MKLLNETNILPFCGPTQLMLRKKKSRSSRRVIVETHLALACGLHPIVRVSRIQNREAWLPRNQSHTLCDFRQGSLPPCVIILKTKG